MRLLQPTGGASVVTRERCNAQRGALAFLTFNFTASHSKLIHIFQYFCEKY